MLRVHTCYSKVETIVLYMLENSFLGEHFLVYIIAAEDVKCKQDINVNKKNIYVYRQQHPTLALTMGIFLSSGR